MTRSLAAKQAHFYLLRPATYGREFDPSPLSYLAVEIYELSGSVCGV